MARKTTTAALGKKPTRKKLIELAIREIANKNDGKVTPQQVVKAAKNPKSPLHKEFNWDVNKAAQAHWIDTARRIIASVEIIVEHHTTEIKVPMFVRDITAAPRAGYITTSQLRTDRQIARDSLIQEFERVKANLARAKALAIALGFAEEIAQLESHVNDLTGNIATKLQSIDVNDMPRA